MTTTSAQWENRVGRRLPLWDLHILHSCVAAGSISKAAATLRLSKPAVSKILTNLERELGVPLVTRSWRGLEPTEAGRTILARSGAAFCELQSAVDSIHDMSGSLAGELRIAANEVALSGLLGTVINRLHEQYPAIVFEVVSAYTRQAQIQELERGNVELVVGQVADTDHHLEAIKLFRDRLVVVGALNNPWTLRDKVELADLMDEPWAFSPLDSLSGRTMEHAFRDQGLPLPRIMVVAPSMQLLRRLVIGSQFLMLLPSSVARSSPGLSVVPLAVNAFWQPIGVLTVKHRTLSPLASLFIQCARSVVQERATDEAAPFAATAAGRDLILYD